MGIEEIKTAIRKMSVADRREIGKLILDLEKENLQAELPEDLKRLSRIVQEEAERMKQIIVEEFERLKRSK